MVMVEHLKSLKPKFAELSKRNTTFEFITFCLTIAKTMLAAFIL